MSKINFNIFQVCIQVSIDDIFIASCSANDINTLIDKTNQLHANLKLMLEHENNNKLPFLDVLVDKSGYTWSGLYLNFHSFTQMP